LEKLVRDRTPDLMRHAGARGQFRSATKPERLRLLLAKLIEEAAELQREPGPGELADVVEAVRAIRRELALSEEQVEAVRAQKEAVRGGFDKGIVLRTGDLSD